MRTKTLKNTLAAVLVALGAATVGITLAVAHADDPELPQWAIETALDWSQAKGDRQPSSVEWVQTSATEVRQALEGITAEDAEASGADPQRKYYMIVLHGHFIERMVGPPPEDSAEESSLKAEWMTLVVDPETEIVEGYYLGDRPDTTILSDDLTAVDL